MGVGLKGCRFLFQSGTRDFSGWPVLTSEQRQQRALNFFLIFCAEMVAGPSVTFQQLKTWDWAPAGEISGSGIANMLDRGSGWANMKNNVVRLIGAGRWGGQGDCS